jgi:hypothetical protein
MVVMNMVDLPQKSITDHIFYKSVFWLKAAVTAGTFNNDTLRVSFYRVADCSEIITADNHGFFNQNVFACVEGFKEYLLMQKWWSRNYHRVNPGVIKDVVVIDGSKGNIESCAFPVNCFLCSGGYTLYLCIPRR